MDDEAIRCHKCHHTGRLHAGWTDDGFMYCKALRCTCTMEWGRIKARYDRKNRSPQDARPLDLMTKVWRAAILSPFAFGLLTLVFGLLAVWTDVRPFIGTTWILIGTTIVTGGFAIYATETDKWSGS